MHLLFANRHVAICDVVFPTSHGAFLTTLGNNGCAARIFSDLPVSTVISARRVRRSPGSPQATDACGAKLALAWCQQPGCRAG